MTTPAGPCQGGAHWPACRAALPGWPLPGWCQGAPFWRVSPRVVPGRPWPRARLRVSPRVVPGRTFLTCQPAPGSRRLRGFPGLGPLTCQSHWSVPGTLVGDLLLLFEANLQSRDKKPWCMRIDAACPCVCTAYVHEICRGTTAYSRFPWPPVVPCDLACCCCRWAARGPSMYT